MKKIAAVAMAQPVYTRPSVTGQSPAHIKEARLLAAAEHRAKLSQLQPVARADAASFAPAASPNAASALADSLSSADLQVDEVRMKYL